ncbi:MAG: VOC family protein [Gammaproteobacteria bacterium]
MKEITRVNHIGLRVKDLLKARSFYEKLGFDFIAGPIGPEPVAIMEHPSGVKLNLILNGSSGASGNILMDVPLKYTGYTHIALEVSDLEAVRRQLKTLKIAISEGPVNFPLGTSLFIRDPDQNVLEFHQPLPD